MKLMKKSLYKRQYLTLQSIRYFCLRPIGLNASAGEISLVKTGEYPRIYLKSYSPIFKTYTSSTIKVFDCNFIQDERTFFGPSRRRNMFVHKIEPGNIEK